MARNLPYARKDEAIAMLREAAAQDNAEACYQLYEHHKSWDRGDLDRVPLVTRTEAAEALRKAAELGHPFATQTLVRRLEDGDIVKRDVVAARYWAERAVANPARDTSRAGLLVTLGRLLLGLVVVMGAAVITVQIVVLNATQSGEPVQLSKLANLPFHNATRLTK